MAIARVNRQVRQPQYPVTVDTANPITRGLVRALVCEATGIRDLMLGTGISVTGTYIPQATESGYGLRNNTITRANYTLVDARTETVSAITIVWAGVVHRVGGTTYPFFRNQQTIVQATSSTGPLWSARFGTTATVNSTTPIKIGSPTTYVYRKDGAIGSLFVDGVPALLNITGGTGAHALAHSIDGNAGFPQSNDITTNVMLIYDRPLSDAESQSLSVNPWQVFRPVQRRVYFDMVAGGGSSTSTVTSDLLSSYNIRGAVAADSSHDYSVRGAVAATIGAAYDIRGSVFENLGASYDVRGSAAASLSASYGVRGSAITDLSASYTVRGSAGADSDVSYAVRGAVHATASPAYDIRGSVTSDLSAAYDILSATSVVADSACAYSIRGTTYATTSPAYDIRGAAGSDLPAAYDIRSATFADLPTSYDIEAGVASVYADLTTSYFIDGAAHPGGLSPSDLAAIRVELAPELAAIFQIQTKVDAAL